MFLLLISICAGDSGGPLMVKQGDYYVQIGINSLRPECAQEHGPCIYTRVTHFLEWIKENKDK